MTAARQAQEQGLLPEEWQPEGKLPIHAPAARDGPAALPPHARRCLVNAARGEADSCCNSGCTYSHAAQPRTTGFQPTWSATVSAWGPAKADNRPGAAQPPRQSFFTQASSALPTPAQPVTS